MQDKDACREVRGLLDGLTDDEVRACCVEALRRWRRRPPPSTKPPGYVGTGHAPPPPEPIEAPTRDVFSMHGDLGLELIPILGERKQRSNLNAHRLKEVFVDHDAMSMVWMQSVCEFTWWFIRAGLASRSSARKGRRFSSG